MPETVTYRAIGKMVTDDKNAWICKTCGDEAASEIARALNRLSCNVKEVREQPPEEMPETRYKSQGREVLRYQPLTGWEPYCTAPTRQEADRIALALGLYLLPLADVSQPECDHTPEFNAAQDDWLCTKCGKGMGKAYRQLAKELKNALRSRDDWRAEAGCQPARAVLAEENSRLRAQIEKLEEKVNGLRLLCSQYQADGVHPVLSCGHPRTAAIEGSDPPYCAICRASEQAEAWRRRFHSIVALHIESAKLFQETLDATTQTH